jgi:putative peptidoglycan lipid II flippase
MGPLGHVGIALATSCAAWANAGLLAWLLARRRHYVADRRARRAVPRILAAALAMGVVVAVLAWLLGAGETAFARAGVTVALIGAGGAAFVGFGVALGAFDLREVVRMLRRRRGGGDATIARP